MVRVGMHRQENEKWCQSKRGEVSDHRRICYSPQSVPFPERARVYHFPPPTFLTLCRRVEYTKEFETSR